VNGPSKPKLVEPLKPVRLLAKPQRFAPLRMFSCGDRNSFSEKLIDKWAREAYRGMRLDAGTENLVLEDARGQLLGLSSFRPDPLNDHEEWLAERDPTYRSAYYIHIIAIDAAYRGQLLADGSRLGDVLLTATLKHIGEACDGRMPRVWAIARAENRSAQALFERSGFGVAAHLDEEKIVYSRRRGSRRFSLRGIFRGLVRSAEHAPESKTDA
jgi:ribosomal protein S18 acetylase RimI-like enzyme